VRRRRTGRRRRGRAGNNERQQVGKQNALSGNTTLREDMGY